MRLIKRIAVIVAACALSLCCVFGMTACQDTGATETVKIGVLVADVSGEEALGFKAYYENYIAENYDVEFEYTEQLTDAAGEKAAIETFAAKGFDAIISLSSSDRAVQIETCAENELYYAIASGMLDDSQYEAYKTNEWFVGQIGPSMDTEYAAGVAMGQYYAGLEGVEKVAVYGAFIPNPMHVYRAAGVLVGLGKSYGGATEKDAIVGQIFMDSGITVSKIGGEGVEVVGYMQGFDPNVTYGELGAIIASEPDAYISVGMATTFFTQQLNEAGISFGDIDSFTAANGTAMNTGKLNYLAGKYSSSIGPIFAAVLNAVNGNAIRGEGNTALSISQDYLVATNYEQFQQYATADKGDSPIFSKAVLDTVIGSNVSYDAFKAFVEESRA